jgi:hypothetical protein
MKNRPSGAWANAVAFDTPVIQLSFFVKPCVTLALPPKRTVALAQGDRLPAASRERARSTC